MDIRISNRPSIDVCKSFAAKTGLKSRNVEKRINARLSGPYSSHNPPPQQHQLPLSKMPRAKKQRTQVRKHSQAHSRGDTKMSKKRTNTSDGVVADAATSRDRTPMAPESPQPHAQKQQHTVGDELLTLVKGKGLGCRV
jgi:hypothetical protein